MAEPVPRFDSLHPATAMPVYVVAYDPDNPSVPILNGGGTGGGTSVVSIGASYPPVNFSYGDISIQPIFTAIKSKTIQKITVVIKAAFNAPATLSIGTPSNHELLVLPAGVDLSALGICEITTFYTPASNETINLYLTAGQSTVGNGTIFIFSA